MATVMIVEDMALFRDPLAASLRRNGHETIIVENGQEAIARLSAGLPDLILLDLAMPVMDGIAFLEFLRHNPATSKIPVIVVSAISERETVSQAKALGVTEYLLKSRFSLWDLLERVNQTLGDATPAESTCAQA